MNAVLVVVMALLLNACATVDVSKMGCNFIYATQKLAEGVNVNVRDSYDETPLHIAVRSNNLEAVIYLVKQGADLEAKNRSGDTPLQLAAGKALKPKMKDDDDEEIKAIYNRRIVAYLIEKGADVNTSDVVGWTPLHHAARFNNMPVIKLLVEHGADLYAQADLSSDAGHTPLHIAAMYGALEAVDYFAYKGVNIYTEDNNGLKPVDLAKMHSESVRDQAKMYKLIRYLQNRHKPIKLTN